jgi:hypothetical protein
MGDRSIIYHVPKQGSILSLGHTHTPLSGFLPEFVPFGEIKNRNPPNEGSVLCG